MEERMARLCWNSNGWRKPSGHEGKSLDISSYEHKNGFGHEEWLFDLEKTIDGYHYGAIQPIGRHQNTYQGQIFNILLYTYNADEKEWYWVGWLKNIEVISHHEAIKIYEEYEKQGWLDLMKEELSSVGANETELNTFTNYCFNIKYLPRDTLSASNGLQLFNSDQKIRHNRYTLLNIDNEIINSFSNQRIEIIETNLNRNTKETFSKSFTEYSKEYKNTHKLIQNAFFDYLNLNKNSKLLKEAQLTKLNCFIDIFQETLSGIKIIYEIKTYVDLQYSIRVALGQLLEYGYYPDRNQKYKLVLVSNKNITEDIKQYIDNLKILFNLDIGILNFDYQNKKINEIYNCKGCDFA